MADKEVVFVQASDAQAAKQLAEDMKKLKENPLNVTRPGGYFIGADGKAHDAWGRPISEKKAGEPDDPAEVEAELAETERKLTELRQRAAVARSQANTRIDADAREHERKLAAGEGDEDEVEEVEDTSAAKKKPAKRK
ncbi:MAG TPA: hypothetical protein VEB19_06195 [Gemmatimonadaceae bacterium]|nr:hypothetical protein [Gemmatimonadaceae bacterium]